MSKMRILNNTTCTGCAWNHYTHNNLCSKNECANCPNSNVEGECNCMSPKLDGEVACPHYKEVNKNTVSVMVTDVNGLAPFINDVGYGNILNILLANGLYTLLYINKKSNL